MSTNIERTVNLVQMSHQQIRTRYDDLTLEMNKVRVVPTYRMIIEIATAILGVACFAVAVALATGLLVVGCSIWLVPTGFALGSALLTFAATSALLRQGELKIERSWRSHAMRWHSFASDLQRALDIAIPKRSRGSTSSESVHSC
ncbi:hypothetical protein C834K_0640 [Chlamydia poikilotherma]|uniref:Uncharacterized protein n=1 Tax=Chlamydia poikilotherma TaxID=1967783 RepID=A0A3B0PPV2_9CHLA|nr:hypothetical protein [Chlamydia poikilotherma]SYX09090.1 hypothetical protein C834K_0640 [Chlamydia poikilotherma]